MGEAPQDMSGFWKIGTAAAAALFVSYNSMNVAEAQVEISPQGSPGAPSSQIFESGGFRVPESNPFGVDQSRVNEIIENLGNAPGVGGVPDNLLPGIDVERTSPLPVAPNPRLPEYPSEIIGLGEASTFTVVPEEDGADFAEQWHHDNKQEIPLPLAKEIEAARSHACNEVAGDWLLSVQMIESHLRQNAGGSVARLQEVLDTQQLSRFKQKSINYEESCLSDLNNLPPDLVRAGIKNIVGVVLVGGHPVCGALRIRSNVFVTARHCLFNKQTEGGSRRVDRSGSHYVALVSDPERSFLVTDLVGHSELSADEQRIYVDSEDYLFLKTADIGIHMPTLNARVAQEWDKIIVTGYYRFHDPDWVFSKESARGVRKDWWNGIRWSNNPMCLVGPVRDPLFNHLCQTDSGFSGAGVLAKDVAETLSFVGIHIAAMDQDTSKQFDTEYTVGNIAIRIDPENSARPLP